MIGDFDFTTEIKIFGGGTAIIGTIQLICGYIFVTTLNCAAEEQVSKAIPLPTLNDRTNAIGIGFFNISWLVVI